MKKIFLTGYFTRVELGLWLGSVTLILASFFIFDQSGYLSLAASLVGVTSLILCAKGNPLGQLLMLVFSALYGIISYGFAYYGEMITYLGMSAPMALLSLISWILHPYRGNRSEVRVNRIRGREWWLLAGLSAAVTVGLYFVLRKLGTASLLFSTLSVTTSFAASYLTLRRSAWFALAYAANDVVLIVLWVIATFSDPSYLGVVICFLAFLANDLYGFFNWRRMEKRQNTQ